MASGGPPDFVGIDRGHFQYPCPTGGLAVRIQSSIDGYIILPCGTTRGEPKIVQASMFWGFEEIKTPIIGVSRVVDFVG